MGRGRETVADGWRSLTRGRGVLLSAGAVCVVIFLVTAVVSVVVPDAPQENGVEREELPELAEGHGLDLGVAVAINPLVHDREYQELASTHYTSVTAENAMKWQHVQPERDEFDWSGPDTVMDYADEHGLDVRGHTLLWHNQQPSWLSEGSWDSDELRGVMREHIQALLGRYEGQVSAWDVINEPFEDDSADMREHVFYQTLGEDYIAEALRMAHEADPEAQLYINEFNIEYAGEKSDALYDLVSDLVEQDVPLDGIGFQSHFVHGEVPEDMAEQMRRYTDLGLEVAVTELDVRIPEPPTEAELQAQAQEYQQVVSACLDVPRCVGVSVWGVSDEHSWIPEWFPGYTAALPFDEDYESKPAYDGMVEALREGPA